MKPNLLLLTLLLIGLCALRPAHAQDRFSQLENRFEAMTIDYPGLEGRVQLSVTGVSIQEFLTGLAETHNLNISVDPSITEKVFNNFVNAKVSDVLLFLCREYNLDVQFTGTIMAFKKHKDLPVASKPYEPKKPKVEYSNQTNFLSLDLKKDSLEYVVQEITSQSFRNVIIAPNARGTLVSVFIQNRPFDNALEMMCLANGLKVVNNGNNFFVIEKDETPQAPAGGNATRNTRGGATNATAKQGSSGSFEMKINELGLISVQAENVPIKELIGTVSRDLLVNYYLYNEPQGNASLYVENSNYEDFLNYLLNGTNYTFKKQDNIYLVGERNLEGLRKTELIQLQNRPVEKIIESIPNELKKDVELKEFLELNGLIVSGSALRIYEIKEFIRQIDQIVPMVMIEVLIIDINKSSTVNTGVSAGLGKNPNTTPTNGSVSPGINMEFSPESVNNIINGFNGLGLINLGNVVPQFYISLKALEDNGNIKMRSTPRISTLNGHQANLKIGNTEYYLEQSSNVYASTTTQTIVTNNYKSVNADLSITIKPFVSSDEQVTLEITVEQSDFTARVAPTAPPGSVSRTFKSIIRVRDGEMIILGGLEEKSLENSSSGIPGIAKIPILRSLFGNNKRSRKNTKLSVMIKPIIIY